MAFGTALTLHDISARRFLRKQRTESLSDRQCVRLRCVRVEIGFLVRPEAATMMRHEDIDDGPLWSKGHKVCCIPCYVPCNAIFFPCRHAVSKNKQRFKKDGFDLDLAYITPRIVVHGFPATGLEHIYRNPRLEIRRFMDKYHSEQYKTYNFCCEPGRGYDPSVFHGRVERYPFKDHHIPPLEVMVDFAQSAKLWLEGGPERVVNMHCKAGKGRAGVMCCVLLVRSGAATSALDAMAQYDARRVTNNKGLTLVSQRKAVIFYEYLWRYCWGVTGDIGRVSAARAAGRGYAVPHQPVLPLAQVEMLHLPTQFLQQHAAFFRVTVHKVTSFRPQLLYDSQKKKANVSTMHTHLEANQYHAQYIPVAGAEGGGLFHQNILAADCAPCLVQGNFKIVVYVSAPTTLRSAKWQKLVELQHNTYFMPKRNAVVDFGVDQMDLPKAMRRLLRRFGGGPGDRATDVAEQLVLRLKFDFSHVSDAYNVDDADELLYDRDFGYAPAQANGQKHMRMAVADDDDFDDAAATDGSTAATGDEIAETAPSLGTPVSLADDDRANSVDGAPSGDGIELSAAGISATADAGGAERATSTQLEAPTLEVSAPEEIDNQLSPQGAGVAEAGAAGSDGPKQKKRLSLSRPLVKFVGRVRRSLHIPRFGTKASADGSSGGEAAEALASTGDGQEAADGGSAADGDAAEEEKHPDSVSLHSNNDVEDDEAKADDASAASVQPPPSGIVEGAIENSRAVLQQLFSQVLSLAADEDIGDNDNDNDNDSNKPATNTPPSDGQAAEETSNSAAQT